MALSFKEVNEMDEHDKLLVAGYIREWADLYDALVPDLVVYTVLSFYHYVLFEDCHECYRLSGQNNNVLTKIDDDRSWDTSAYAKDWISSTCNKIIKWKITIHQSTASAGLMIGVINNQHHHTVEKDIDATGSYLYCSSGYVFQHGISLRLRNGFAMGEGDAAIFALDLDSKQIRMSSVEDDEIWEERILFEDIPIGVDIKYKLAIGMHCVDDSMTVTVI